MKPSSVGLWASILVICALPVSQANAAVKVYLHLETIQGDVQVNGLPSNLIEVLEWEWGLGQAVDSSTSSAKSGGVVARDLRVTSYNGKATAKLIEAVTSGQHVTRGMLAIVNPATGARVEQLEFQDVIVTSLTTGVTGDADRPVTTITLRFASFKYTYTVFNSSGAAAGQIETQYDFSQGK